MKLSKLFMVLGASLALSLTSQAQISVPDAGVGPLTFDATPPATEWATFSIAGAGGTLVNETQLDAAVAALTQGGITAALGTSATEPPSGNALFRRHTVRNSIFSRTTGNNASVLKASLQNGSANAKSGVRVSYDLAQTDAIAEQILGHRVYYSIDGSANSWQPVGTFSTVGATTFDVNVGSWPASSSLYLLWVDDNADPGTDGAFLIDNVRFELFDNNDPVSIVLLTPIDGQTVVQTANLNVTLGPVARVEFLIDGNLYLNDTAAPFGGAFPAIDPPFSVGNHTIQAIAYDAGNTPTSSSISNFTVIANTGPTIVITNTFTTNIVNGRINNGPYLVGSFVTVQATVTDDVAVTNVDWYVDGTLYVSRPGPNFNFTYNDSRAGSHMIHGIASDAGGLTTMSASVTVVVTNPSPNFVVLVPNGSDWYTFASAGAPPVDNIPFPWYQGGYDYLGQGWSNLVAEIGGGDRVDGIPESSEVDLGPAATRHRSIYFRKEVAVVNPGQYQNFRLNLLRDDGAIVFINDSPVWTNNMRSTDDNGLFLNDFSTNLALVAAGDDGLVYQTFNIDSANYPQLLNGNWTIGVEVHQNAIGSSDLSFDFMLWGEFATLPTLAITSPTNNQTFREGDSATVAVSASTFVTNATLYLDGNLYGTDDTLPYSIVVSNLTPGMHTLVARGTDTQGNPEASSATITINVLPNMAPTGVAITNLIDGTNLLVGGFLINVGATATDDGGVTRVEFYDNGVLRATDTTSPYAAALMVDFTVGTHQITARAFDGAGLSTLSAPITVNVTNPPARTAVLTNRADWRYEAPAADITDWYTSSFVDSGWAVGPAKFGFGGDGETTLLARTNMTSGATNVAFYFRKQVDLTGQLASFGGIDLWLLRDDGAVVYVNGVEVYRNKMADPVPVPFNALATGAAIGGNDENTFLTPTNLPTSLFVNGMNTIAVEVHQNVVTSSDVGFDLMLWGTAAGGPTVTITLEANGDVTLTWPGGGTLIGSDDVTAPRASWTVVPGASPVTIAAGSLLAKRFYAVLVP
jgi:Bacterial Ig domain